MVSKISSSFSRGVKSNIWTFPSGKLFCAPGSSIYLDRRNYIDGQYIVQKFCIFMWCFRLLIFHLCHLDFPMLDSWGNQTLCAAESVSIQSTKLLRSVRGICQSFGIRDFAAFLPNCSLTQVWHQTSVFWRDCHQAREWGYLCSLVPQRNQFPSWTNAESKVHDFHYLKHNQQYNLLTLPESIWFLTYELYFNQV